MISQDDLSTLRDGMEVLRRKMAIFNKYKGLHHTGSVVVAEEVARLKEDIRKLRALIDGLKELAND
jgi:formate dehydrogenase assembly factor FdhD